MNDGLEVQQQQKIIEMKIKKHEKKQKLEEII